MMTRLSKPLIKIKQISFIFNTTEIIMSIYVSANYNYRIEENVNFYLKMNLYKQDRRCGLQTIPVIVRQRWHYLQFPGQEITAEYSLS